MPDDKRFYKNSKLLALNSLLLNFRSVRYALCFLLSVSGSKLFAFGFKLLALSSSLLALRSMLFALSLSLVFVGCSSVPEQGQTPDYYGPNYGQVTIYLNGPEKASIDVTFDLLAVNIVAEGGILKEIMNTPLSINSLALTNRQVILAQIALPEGRYEKLRFTVKRATIKKKEVADLSIPPEGYEIPVNITVTRNQNTT